MVFTSAIFIFLFMPVLLFFYFIFQKWIKNYLLLFFSMVFFGWAEPKFIFIVIFSAFIDWICGKLIFHYRDTALWKRKLFVIIGILQNVGILFFYKYTNFFIDNINTLLTHLKMNPFIISKVLLPIGVSFIVFEKITYIVDIYRHEGNPSPSFINYLLYVFFFPKLLAGPIIKYHDIAAQLETHKHDLESVVIGVTRFCLGFAKKVFIADTMGEVVDQVFGLGAGHLGFYNAWLGVICYTLQIYFDFSGYSDMAIGLARIFGFKLFENFNNPYISKNFTEFWRRWHISLSSWIRNYLYIPMGGNRVPKSRMYFNLWLCFFLSGIWHGASWSFVVWGAYHGFFMILDKLGWTKIQKKIPGFINITITFILVMIGWTIFRAETIGQAFYFMKTMINPADMNGSFIYITSNVKFFFCVGIAFCFLPASDIFNKLKEKVSNMQMAEVYKLGISSLLFILSLCKMAAISFNPFLYFRF